MSHRMPHDQREYELVKVALKCEKILEKQVFDLTRQCWHGTRLASSQALATGDLPTYAIGHLLCYADGRGDGSADVLDFLVLVQT